MNAVQAGKAEKDQFNWSYWTRSKNILDGVSFGPDMDHNFADYFGDDPNSAGK